MPENKYVFLIVCIIRRLCPLKNMPLRQGWLSLGGLSIRHKNIADEVVLPWADLTYVHGFQMPLSTKSVLFRSVEKALALTQGICESYVKFSQLLYAEASGVPLFCSYPQFRPSQKAIHGRVCGRGDVSGTAVVAMRCIYRQTAVPPWVTCRWCVSWGHYAGIGCAGLAHNWSTCVMLWLSACCISCFKRRPFAVWNAVFCSLKCHVLQPEMPHIAILLFCIAVGDAAHSSVRVLFCSQWRWVIQA